MPPIGPTLETPRLILRPPIQDDFPAWGASMADPEVARFIGGVQSASVAWRAMAAVTGSWTLLGFSMFSVIERESGRWIGRLGPWRPEGWPGSEIGWALSRDIWGRGYALEGVIAATDWAFDTLGWTDVIHTISPENARSIALAEKLGSRRLRSLVLPPPHDPAPVDIWGQGAVEWRTRAR